jgi:AcrR family transcriptional regulator
MADVPAPRRGPGRPGYDQETVLRRAIELFNRQGYDATSMGDLAKELGFSKSALYHHVDSKSSLLEQALDEALDHHEAALAAAARTPGTTADEKLRLAVEGSIEVLVAHLPAVTLLLRVRGNSDVELAALERRRRIDDRLARMVRAAVKEGALRDDLPADLISRLLFGQVNSLVEWVRPEGRYDAAELARAVATIAFEGLERRG